MNPLPLDSRRIHQLLLLRLRQTGGSVADLAREAGLSTPLVRGFLDDPEAAGPGIARRLEAVLPVAWARPRSRLARALRRLGVWVLHALPLLRWLAQGGLDLLREWLAAWVPPLLDLAAKL